MESHTLFTLLVILNLLLAKDHCNGVITLPVFNFNSMKSDLVSILAPPSAFSTAVPGTPAKSQGWPLSPEKAERPWAVHTTLKPGVSLLLNPVLGAVPVSMGHLRREQKGSASREES